MKKTAILLSLGVLLTASCEEREPLDNGSNQPCCDQDVIISPTEFVTLPAVFPIQDLRIIDNCLKMKICSSGCSGSSWVVKLVACCISDAAVYPPEWNLRVSFENREICAAVPCREFSFNIEDLQLQGTNKVQLNVSGNSILYEY